VTEPESKAILKSPVEAFDIVIVGGGMVGATLAAAVSQRFGEHMRVAIIERDKVSQAPPSTFDLRSIVLSRSTVRFLHQQGWWPQILPLSTPIHTVAVERARQMGRVHFTAEEADVPALGYVIGNSDLGAQLWQQLALQQHVRVFDGCVLQQAVRTTQGWFFDVVPCAQSGMAGSSPGQHVSARLLIVADGADSQTLKNLGVASDKVPYGQHAMVVGLSGIDWDPGLALERFLPGGESVAVLPRGESTVGVVMAAAPAMVADWSNLPNTKLIDVIAQRVGRASRELGFCVERGCYPLVAGMAEELVRSNLLVVGNAAQTLHPIAGQGFNLAVRDLATFLGVLSTCESRRRRGMLMGSDLVPMLSLQAYAQSRAGDRRRIRAFCHQLLSVFAWESPVLLACRQVGMALFDTLPASKAWLAHSTLAPRVGPHPAWSAAERIS